MLIGTVMIVPGLLTREPLSMLLHMGITSHLTKMVILVLSRWETNFQAKLLVLMTLP